MTETPAATTGAAATTGRPDSAPAAADQPITTPTSGNETTTTGAETGSGDSAGASTGQSGTGDSGTGDSGTGGQAGAGTNGTFTPAATSPAPGTDLPVGVPQVGATIPAAPAAPVAEAAPPPAPATPGPLATQLATRITPLRLDADGVHRLTVNLHPADLGPVQVIAEIRNGEISVQLSSSTDAGHESLRDALDDLRRELAQSGFSNTSLDLRQGSPQERARQQFTLPGNDRGGRQPADAENPPPVPAAPSTPRTSGNNRLDIEA